MKILTSYNALGLSPDAPAEKVVDGLINEFESDSTHNGPLSYLQNWIVSHSANITTGRISKTKILSEITLWNNNAVFHAIRACEQLDNAQYFASDVTTDKAQTVYRDVYNAVGVILNKFHPTQPGVYLDNPMGYPYWRTLLTEAEIKDIEAHPEKYLIVDLQFTHHPA